MTFLPPKNYLVFDGAIGTQLQKRGHQLNNYFEEYNLLHPKIVRDIHEAYVLAGSDIIQTNTFGANSIRLAKYGLESRTTEINKRAVELARDACKHPTLIAGCMGPIGELIEPLGNIPKNVARNSFQKQAEGLMNADFINIETMISLNEVYLAIEAIRTVSTLPISVSMTFHKTPRGFFTLMGESLQECISNLSTYDVFMIGSNCGEGFDQMVEIMVEMVKFTELPLFAKPNAGLPIWDQHKEIYPEDPISIRPKVKKLYQMGVRLVGGCCGTTPEHVKTIRQVAEYLNNRLMSQ